MAYLPSPTLADFVAMRRYNSAYNFRPVGRDHWLDAPRAAPRRPRPRGLRGRSLVLADVTGRYVFAPCSTKTAQAGGCSMHFAKL